ncbi:hypothetical protein [Paroceanicella profunda]|nr:hypothetical protein [Paroceanicella profunda]
MATLIRIVRDTDPARRAAAEDVVGLMALTVLLVALFGVAGMF